MRDQLANQAKLDFDINSENDFDVEEERELWDRIDKIRKQMDDNESSEDAHTVDVQIMLGSTVSLTAGVVSWILRGGSLLASFLSTVPLLNRFDPLPILKSRHKSKQVAPDSKDEEESEHSEENNKVDELFSDNKLDEH